MAEKQPAPAHDPYAGPEETPDLSVVILTCNAKGLLETCLRSIEEHTHRSKLEIFVVDNGSTDGTGEMVKEQFPRVIHIYRTAPFSFTKANNEGLRRSRGRHVMILNDDTELRNDAFDQTVEYFDNHPECGALGCKLLNPDLTVQYSCRRFPSFAAAFSSRYSFLTKILPGNPFSTNYLMTDFTHDKTIEVDWVSGACLAVTREMMDEIGMLDENIILFTEDVDWCYRVNQAGKKVIYLHSAQIIHHIGQVRRKRALYFIYIHHRSMFYFYLKHYSKNIILIDMAVSLGVGLRLGAKVVQELVGRLSLPREAKQK